METSASNPNPLAKSLAIALVLTVAGVLIMASRVTPGSAALQERIFENKIPAHIPIKIKIKKEKEQSFKDLKNEKWLREFELELTNTGDRPIYYLEIVMDTDVRLSGPEIVFPLRYGRPELGDIVTKAKSDDVPIKPGETIILTTGDTTAWEKGVRERGWPQPTKFKALIQVVSFGDGTGYWGTELYPPPGRRKAAVNNNKPPQVPKARPRRGAQSKIAAAFKPAYMPANFLSSKNVITAVPSATQPFVDCLFPHCQKVIPHTEYVCWDNRERAECQFQNRPTPDLTGVRAASFMMSLLPCTIENWRK